MTDDEMREAWSEVWPLRFNFSVDANIKHFEGRWLLDSWIYDLPVMQIAFWFEEMQERWGDEP